MNQVTYIPVIDANEQPLAPCHPARARKLIKKGRAKPFIRWDLFCLQLVDKTIPPEEVHQSTLAINPGAEHTGIAAFRQNPKTGKRTGLLAMTIHHRGKQVKHWLEQRKNYRGARRGRLRYRAPRFSNRTKPKGWLAPSLQSRLDNTQVAKIDAGQCIQPPVPPGQHPHLDCPAPKAHRLRADPG